jgi:hypothetical protein
MMLVTSGSSIGRTLGNLFKSVCISQLMHNKVTRERLQRRTSEIEECRVASIRIHARHTGIIIIRFITTTAQISFFY